MTNEKLNSILNNLCEGIAIPACQSDVIDQNTNNRMIELFEINNYPYPQLQCTHLVEKGISEDCIECQHQQYETYKKRYLELVKEKSYTHTHTLKAAFDYYSALITQYKLTECDELLNEIYPVCLRRESWSTFYILAIQARAFLCFKQNKYQESLAYFQKQLDLFGPNEKIYENMALVYYRLNQNKEAAAAYGKAILLIQQQPVETQNFVTLLMGLAGVLENIDDALVVLEESMALLRRRFNKPHSLIAKTLGAMGDLYMKKCAYTAAEHCYNEAMQIFIETCGLESPLTANAMNKEANCLLQLGHQDKAYDVFLNALKVWSNVDNYSFSANAVCEALIALSKSHNLNMLTSVLESLQNKLIYNPVLANDINALCLLKFICELYLIQKDIPHAISCCHVFKEGLSKLDVTKLGDNISFRNQFLQETTELLTLLEAIPMHSVK